MNPSANDTSFFDAKRTPVPAGEASWKAELRTALRTVEDLVQAGLISASEVARYREVLGKYRFTLPRYYADLIDRNDPDCPIRLQCIPSLLELGESSDRLPDPLRDGDHQPVERVTHRYRDRLLIHLTPACSMYCRFCFRKSLLNELSETLFEGSLERALGYVREATTVREVIFSGGDPFLSSESILRDVLDRLDRLEHIKRIRFHTRVPVTLPSRVTPELAHRLTNHSKKTVVITHFNHPRELTARSRAAIATLNAHGSTVLNQTVLLARVNDDASTLEALFEGLFEAGALPYYLHHPDRATGTGHFDVDLERGKAIYRELRARMAGYLVPRYVVDRIDLPYKSLVSEL